MGTLIGALGLMLTLILLWTGWQRLEFNTFQKTLTISSLISEFGTSSCIAFASSPALRARTFARS
jgi:hypothetical protein